MRWKPSHGPGPHHPGSEWRKKERWMERVTAQVKAEEELPVRSQGRDGHRGGKKIRRKRSHVRVPAHIPENGFQERWAKPACRG